MESTAGTTDRPRSTAPRLGQHTDEVMTELADVARGSAAKGYKGAP